MTESNRMLYVMISQQVKLFCFLVMLQREATSKPLMLWTQQSTNILICSYIPMK